MSEPEKPKQTDWQIHLSTTVLLMFAASALLGANLSRNLFFELHCVNNITGLGADYYGFPLCVYSTSGLSYDQYPLGYICVDETFNSFDFLEPTWLLFEWLIRRREGRKS